MSTGPVHLVPVVPIFFFPIGVLPPTQVYLSRPAASCVNRPSERERTNGHGSRAVDNTIALSLEGPRGPEGVAQDEPTVRISCGNPRVLSRVSLRNEDLAVLVKGVNPYLRTTDPGGRGKHLGTIGLGKPKRP